MKEKDKFCYVCGRKIPPSSPYYSHGPNTYICTNPECFTTAFWDQYAARWAADKHHYPIINGKAYSIDGSDQEEKDFGGEKYTIMFDDGITVATDSLWYVGEVPEVYPSLKDNAVILH